VGEFFRLKIEPLDLILPPAKQYPTPQAFANLPEIIVEAFKAYPYGQSDPEIDQIEKCQASSPNSINFGC